jgi:hypothetical protein
MITSKRRGTIKIDIDFINNEENKAILSNLFSRFIPIFTQHDCMNDAITYSGISDEFREVPGNARTPVYRVICNDFDGTIKFEEVK